MEETKIALIAGLSYSILDSIEAIYLMVADIDIVTVRADCQGTRYEVTVYH